MYAVRAGYTSGRCCFADAKHAAKVLSIPNIKLLAEKKIKKILLLFRIIDTHNGNDDSRPDSVF